MPSPVQKYLGWFHRYLYAVETGNPIPIPAPVCDVANEPFRWLEVRGSITTVAGNATLDFTTPETRQRLHVWAFISGAPAFAATDNVQLCLLKDGLTYPMVELNNITGTLVSRIPLINAKVLDAAAPTIVAPSCREVMVGPGETLRVIASSAAGGTTGTYRGLCIDLPAYAPFPNVF